MKTANPRNMMPGEGLSYVLHRLRQLVSGGDAAADGDAELLERFARRGDQAAFTELMQRHGPMVLGLCRRLIPDAHEAEDAFQSTFLVLAHKAGSIRRQASVGSWLYGVAHRIARLACKARGRMMVGDVTQLPSPDNAAAQVETRELGPLIDAELNRLPAKYRAPIVLCYLEEKTNEEAARELGWPKGTVQGRLARARDLLKDRLSRRGVTLSAGALAALAAGRASALPANLVGSTAAAAALVDVGRPITDAVSPGAASLTQGVLQDMLLTKLKWSLAILAAVLGIGMVSTVLLRPGSSPMAAAAVNLKPEVPPKEPTIAWGEPRDGLRLGLAPGEITMARDDTEITVTIWQENVSKEVRNVYLQQRVNHQLRLMFAGENNGKPFFANFVIAHNGTTRQRIVPLGPGKRLHEEFILRPGDDAPRDWYGVGSGGLHGLPGLDAGKSLTLRAGVCAKGDTNGEESWKAADTLRSAPITVKRAAAGAAAPAASAVPVAVPAPAPGAVAPQLVHTPIIVWTGPYSAIDKQSYARITDRNEWEKLWKRHVGNNGEKGIGGKDVIVPEVNFDACMVVAVLDGDTFNSRGFDAFSITEDNEQVVFRLQDRSFSTIGRDGGAIAVRPYGFFLLPRSTKRLVLERDVRTVKNEGPKWKEVARAEKMEAPSPVNKGAEGPKPAGAPAP